MSSPDAAGWMRQDWIIEEAGIQVTVKWELTPCTGVIKITAEPFCHLTFRLNDAVIRMGGMRVVMSFVSDRSVTRTGVALGSITLGCFAYQ